MKQIWKLLLSLDWRALVAVPVLSMLLGIANNMRVPEDQRVRWTGERDEKKPSDVASSVARRGVWTSDFEAATNKAAAARLPVVVVVEQEGCAYCARLHKILAGDVVRSWQKERGWYFVLTTRESSPQAAELAATTPATNTVAPYVGVYWTRADGTRTMNNFSGRHGMMGVAMDKSLALEWMHAVEESVRGAPGIEGGVSAASIVDKMKKRIAVKTELEEGAKGRARMSKHLSFLKEGQSVDLIAEAKRGSLFVGWRYPDGRILYGKYRVKIDSFCPEGTYKAIFRRPENCAAPVLNLPKQDVNWTAWKQEKMALEVNHEAYPVSFSCKNLPPGMQLIPLRNVISGRPRTNGVWRVKVTATSATHSLPTALGAFTVRVAPAPRPEYGDDDVDEDDEVN